MYNLNCLLVGKGNEKASSSGGGVGGIVWKYNVSYQLPFSLAWEPRCIEHLQMQFLIAMAKEVNSFLKVEKYKVTYGEDSLTAEFQLAPCPLKVFGKRLRAHSFWQCQVFGQYVEEWSEGNLMIANECSTRIQSFHEDMTCRIFQCKLIAWRKGRKEK